MLTPTWPTADYLSPVAHALDLNTRFARTWQCVAQARDLAAPGSFVTALLGSEPILLTRDAAGVLRALSNVCRHRAGPVASGSGVRQRHTCGYHGWTYNLDGALLAAPELDLAQLPAHCTQLPRFDCAEWGPWVFVRRAAEGPAFEDWLGDMATEVGAYDLARVGFVQRMTYPLACNWKVYIENYLEPYHLPLVHPALHRMTDYAGYTIDCHDWHVRQMGPPRASAPAEATALGDAVHPEAAWYWAFPNFIVNCSFGLISSNQIVPTSPTTCDLICDFYALPDADPAATATAIEFSHQVQLEDITICEAVQRGLASANYQAGILHPTREIAVAHFHALLAKTGR